MSWIVDEFPRTARMALLHLLDDLAESEYVQGWVALDKELRRLAREAPAVNRGSTEARISVEEILETMKWDKVYDFCERLYSHLAKGVAYWNSDYEREVETASIGDVKRYIAEELERIFLEEHFGYVFVDGFVLRKGRNHTTELVSKVEPSLGDPRLNGARAHYKKALQYFRHPSRADYENAVKEAVCAVEAAARSLFPNTGGKTLGEVMKRVQGTGEGQLPKPLVDTFIGLYGYRNSGDGVSHGGADGGKVTPTIAEYTIALAASQILLLCEVASAGESDVPF